MTLQQGGHTAEHSRFHLSLEEARQLLGPALVLAALLLLPIDHSWQFFGIVFVGGVVSGGISGVILVPAALISAWTIDAILGDGFGPSSDGGRIWLWISLIMFSSFLALAGIAVAAVLRPWLGPEDPRP